MKSTYLLVAAAAIFATAACNAVKTSDSSGSNATEAKPVPAPKGGDWTQTVTATAAGGFQMGNPNASVKLIEFGSMTCPHCREFDEKGAGPLINTFVKTGRVAYEFRNYVRDPYDLAGALITRCNGPKGFFPLTRAMYKDQNNWIAKLQAVPPAQQQALGNLPPNQQFVEIAKLAGFQQWAAMRGVPSAKANACLANEAEVNRLVQMNSDATTQFPDFQGTPTFIINGKMLDKTATWEALEPQLRKAVGG
ncbi:thioredoxin domain-containing protein [Sphingomonas sp.]|uniref:thioredoxin domain-containing protein n=1 Tax=Sphingomonas sp. TaxID=28214 RepID=UPI00286A3F63|nr:thioredoxin domain-containing protein [Sphingomonas sp.]